MRDPYQVLGISPTATNEEVRNAYRALAKKYHPDNYVDSPLAQMAEERMKEINEAYDEILRQRTASSNNTSSNNTNSSNSYYTNNDPVYAQVRSLINKGDYKTAENMLNEISQIERGGEWFFLKGCILVHKGYYFDALRYLDRACELDPGNREYATLRDNLRVQSNQYSSATSRVDGGCSMCDVCSFLICLDCLCR